jgi:hypothetical protein
MIGLKTWSARRGNKVIIVTAECVEVARQLVADRHGIELANVDLVPVVTQLQWSRVIESDNAAIVAELRRLSGALKHEAKQSQDPLSKAMAVGLSLAMKDAARVVQAGGALPPESLSDDSNQVSE